MSEWVSEWSPRVRAALSEGLCPTDGNRLTPVPSAAKIAGHCGSCGHYFWSGGPDKQWAEVGQVLDVRRVP